MPQAPKNLVMPILRDILDGDNLFDILGGGTLIPPEDYFILLETGDFILTETGDLILLET
jgi:hypothetical protein